MIVSILFSYIRFYYLGFCGLILFILGACKKEDIKNSRPVSNLVVIPDQRMPYPFTKTNGRAMVLSIPGLEEFANPTAETQNWLHLKEHKFQRIIGSIDTLGLELDEFFDSLRPNTIRKTPISISANGLKTVYLTITQKSFPFIFGTKLWLENKTQAPSTQTHISNHKLSDITRQDKIWTLSFQLQDTNKIILLPIYYDKSTKPILNYMRGEGVANQDSLLYGISQQTPNQNSIQNTVKFIARDTNLSNEKYLLLKLKADKNSKTTHVGTIFIGKEPEQITLKINIRH